MIRSVLVEDIPLLVALAAETGVFKPREIQALREVLDDYRENQAEGHACVALERDGVIRGFAYHAPEAMTDRTWSLWWIAVRRTEQARGLGSELMARVEADATGADARVLFIDTSSLAHYEPTRRFYEKHGYRVAAVLADWYAEGDDKVIFRKRLARS